MAPCAPAPSGRRYRLTLTLTLTRRARLSASRQDQDQALLLRPLLRAGRYLAGGAAATYLESCCASSIGLALALALTLPNPNPNQVYAQTAKELVPRVVEGYNACCFAYGNPTLT